MFQSKYKPILVFESQNVKIHLNQQFIEWENSQWFLNKKIPYKCLIQKG